MSSLQLQAAPTARSPDQDDLWERVRFVYADGRACATCQYKHTTLEPHGEVLRFCDLLDHEARYDPPDCPGLETE